MTQTVNVPPELIAIFCEELRDPNLELTASMTADDVPGWDSAAMVGILMAIEELLGIELGAKEVKQIETVGDLAGIMERHVK